MEDGTILHVVVFPWLAMGHLIPFFRLSKCFAQKGHQISFVSTPRNLLRIPKIPPHLSHLIKIVSLSLPHIDGLPGHAESSADLPYKKQQLLKIAFDSLEIPLAHFLRESAPDWIIYDYASHWLPQLAAQLGISRVFFSLFTAASLAFIGPPSMLIDGSDSRVKGEDFTVVPEWVPKDSEIVYRLHEVSKYVDGSSGNESGTSDTVRFGISIEGSDIVAVRSSVELEPDWFDLLVELYRKPVVPAGFLPPVMDDEEVDDEDEDKKLDCNINDWLDKQRVNSVVYVALGTEATLNQEELTELALGLEQSGLPFFWVLRTFPSSTQSELDMLPSGYEERVKGFGMLYVGWAPQVKILSHESVGGFLTHCGWNSIIEGLGFGRVLLLFPVLNEQGLNARLLQGKKLGVEIEREPSDGSFTSESVAESMRLAMVDDSGEILRGRAKEVKDLFGNKYSNDHKVDMLVQVLKEHRSSVLHSSKRR